MLGAPLLRELALAGPEHLDAAYVAGYDRKANHDPRDDLEELRRRGLGPSSTLVDLGAGTGTFAVAAASTGARVVAVDISPAMIEAARAKAAESGTAGVEFVLAGLLSYEHRGAPADFAYSRNALHHLPGLLEGDRALRRLAALLVPGGMSAPRPCVLVRHRGTRSAHRGLARLAANAPEDGWTRDELATHLRDEYSTFTWLLEPMIVAGVRRFAAAEYTPNGVHAAYVCVKNRS